MQGCDSLFSADSSAMICAWGVNSRTGRDDADGTGSPRTQSAHHLQPTAVAQEAHEGDIYALTVHADVVVSAGADQRVRLWSLGGLAPEGALAVRKRHDRVLLTVRVVHQHDQAQRRRASRRLRLLEGAALQEN